MSRQGETLRRESLLDEHNGPPAGSRFHSVLPATVGRETGRCGDKNGSISLRVGLVRQELALRLLEVLNTAGTRTDTIHDILVLIKEYTGIEAVGIRLRDGDDFPYYSTTGFPARFVEAERYLCAYDRDGKALRDSTGDPILECMCGNVICGRTNPSLPFFTEGGSFWSNGTSELLASTTEEDRQARTRNRCNREGYESVALVPLRSENEVIGLLQLDDIHFFEELGASVGIALARKQAEEALRESEERHRTLFETMSQGVVYQAVDGRIVAANPAAERVLGLTFDQMEGRTSMDPRWRAIREDGSDLLGEEHPSMVALRTGEEVRNVVMGVFNPEDDSHHWISVGAVPQFQPGAAEPYQVYTTFTDITDQVVAAEALRESENRYRTFSELTSDGIVIHEAGKLVEVNQKFAGLLGYEVQEILEADGFQLVIPEDRDRLRESVLSGDTRPYETTGLRKDGTVFPMEAQATEVAYKDRVVRMVAVRDITERKRMEEGQRLHSEITRNMSEGVMLVRAGDGVIVYTNPKFEEIFGYGPGEMLGKHVSMVNAPSDQDPEEKAEEIMGTLGEIGEWHGEINNIRKDGTDFWCQASVSVFDHHENGSVMVSVHTDITERKQAEEALRESEEKWRSLTEDSPDHIMMVDLEGKILFINRTVPDLRVDEVIGKPCFDFQPEEFHPRVRECLSRVYNTGRPDMYEVDYHDKEGTIHSFEVRVSPVQRAGQVVAFIVNSTDITERRRMEQQLQRAGRLAAVGELAAGVAHELNNPLTIVQGFAEFLVARHDLDDTAREDV